MSYRLLLVCCFAFCVSEASAQLDSIYGMAESSYQEQDYSNALNGFEECLALDSLSIPSHEKAGLCATRLGEHPKAKKLFLKLITIDSANTTAMRQLASLYEQEENIPKAIKYYNFLTDAYPDNGVYFRKLGQLYGEAKLKADALKNYKISNALNPRDLLTIKGLAQFHLSEKKYTTVDSLLHQALKMDSLNIRLNMLMANSKFRQRQYDSTAVYMETITGKYVLKPYHQKMLGYAYLQIDSFDRAIYHLNKALTNEGTKEYAHYNLASAHEAKEDMESAKYHFQEAIKAGRSDDLDLYHRNLARLYAKEDNMKEAIPHYQDAYKYSKDPLLLFFLARATDQYYKDKNIALRYYQKFVKSAYDHPEYMDYSKKQIRYLKEQLHQGG